MAALHDSRTARTRVRKALSGFRATAMNRLRRRLGGRERTRAIVLFGGVLALDTADLSALGAVAGPLKTSLHVTNTELGLLAALPSLAAAVGTLPMGMLADRVRRVPILVISLVVWAAAMVLSGLAGSYDELVLFRLFLGIATATAGPVLASLIGDMFEPGERGRVYGLILSGELIGGGLGLEFAGTIGGATSWRVAMWLLALPCVALAYGLWRWLDEPARGGAGRLPGRFAGPRGRDESPDAAKVVRRRHARPRPNLVLQCDPTRMPVFDAVRYVLRVPTNVVLILSSSLGYFFQAGVNTFGVLYVSGHFALSSSVATLLLGVVALGAIAGVILGGRVADRLLGHGHASARMVVGGVAYVVCSVLYVPGILLHDLPLAMLVLLAATFALAVPNAPLDAARLDVIPNRLRGRAEAVRTVARSLAIAAAPLAFGYVSDELGRGRLRSSTAGIGYSTSASGLRWTFLLMLVPMAVSGLILLHWRGAYVRDTATADASQREIDAPRAGEEGERDDSARPSAKAHAQPS